MITLPMDMLQEIHEESLAECLSITADLMKELVGTNLHVYGNVELTRAQRIERFVDFADRGVLDVLQTIAEPTYEMLLRDFERDMASSQIEGE